MAEPEEGLLEGGATFLIDGVEVNPAGRSYTAVHNYAHYFWRPYLGNTAFALWELLLSFCYGDGDTVYPSISRLARMLTNSDKNRAVVTGRYRATKAPGVSRDSGALGILLRERLVQVARQGEGAMTSYTFRVLKTLPVLRPDQLARLSSCLQQDHRVWLERRGIDAAAYHEAFASAGGAEAADAHAPDCPSRTARAAGRPYAPALTPPRAAGTTPSARRSTGEARGITGAVPGSTNHPQEESLPNQWWKEALAELKPQLTRSTFEICLLRSSVQSFQDGVLTLRAPSPLVQDSMQHRLLPLLRRTLYEISHGEVRDVEVE